MNSIILLSIELLICLVTTIILYIKYKEEGIYSYIIIAFILSSIMSLKTINILNFDTNLGIVPFVSIFPAANILIQKKGPEDQKNLIMILLSASLTAFIIMYLGSKLNNSDINLFTSASYDNLFSIDNLRLFFANIVTILYTLLLNSKLYAYLKKTQNNILVSNLFSSIIINFLASILFCIIGYTFIKEPIDIIKFIMIRYLVSLIVGLSGTISIYISKYIK